MMPIQTSVKQTYDQIGADFSATRTHLLPEVVALLPKLNPKSTILDLGCGNGVLLTALPKSTDYTGIDFSQTLIREAKKLHPGAKFVLGDILDPNIWPGLGEYDFIVALAVFHHLPDHQSQLNLFAQIKTHLKPTGSLLISVWDLTKAKFDPYRQGKHLSIPFHGGAKRFFYAFTPSELENLAQKAGFTQTKSVVSRNNFYLSLTT